jgi:hypothetical protein
LVDSAARSIVGRWVHTNVLTEVGANGSRRRRK